MRLKYKYPRILAAEVRALLRTSLLPALAAIFLLLAAAALYYGRSVMVTHQSTLDSIRQDYQQLFDKLHHQLYADTTTPQGKTDYIMATHPAVIDYRLHRTAYQPPAPLSLLAIGMSDITRYYYPVTINRNYIPSEEKVNNPEHLFSGNFDAAFLVIYLLPLLAICLSYNLLSQEKEQGTLTLLVIQNGSLTRILLMRLLLRYLILLLAIVLLTMMGITLGIILAKPPSFPWRDTFAWVCVCSAYAALWMGLIWFILCWNANASANLVAMGGAWLLLLVVLPAVCQLSLHTAYTTDGTATYASRQREIEWDTWDLSQRALLDSFYADYPGYRNAQAYDTGAASSRRLMAYYALVSKRMERVMAPQEASNQQQLQTVKAAYLYNPAVYTQALLNGLAHTDAADDAYFRQQANAFREQWKLFFYDLHFNDKKFTEADYTALPAYHPSYNPAGSQQWPAGAAYLLAWAAVAVLAGIGVLWKTQGQQNYSSIISQ